MKLADGIFFREESDHTGFLFSFEDCSSLLLNRMGVLIIKLILAGYPEKELLPELQRMASSPLPERAQKDVAGFLHTLKEKGYLINSAELS